MVRTTQGWEAELERVSSPYWCGNPDQQKAVAEVVRLRKELEELHYNLGSDDPGSSDYMYLQGWDYALDLVDRAIAEILNGESSND